MKRFLFSFFVAFLFGLTLHAQNGFNVKVSEYKTFVKIRDGVNLRKAPDAKSPRLLLMGEDGCYDCSGEPQFSLRSPRPDIDRVAHTNLAPVIGESGDWYQILYTDENLGYHVCVKAYVMKQFCTKVVRRSLSLPAPVNEWGGTYHVAKVADGPCKDYYLRFYYGMFDEPFFELGKYVDGMFVFTKSLPCEEYEGTAIKISSSDDRTVLQFPANLFPGDTKGVEKLAHNAQAVNYLFSNVSKFNDTSDIFFGLEGDKEWHWMCAE